jgi:hypothetical protein
MTNSWFVFFPLNLKLFDISVRAFSNNLLFGGLGFQVVQLYSCLDKISYIEWAPDSEYLLCGLFKRAIVQAWSVTQPEWTCKIDEGSIGIVHAR